MINIKTTMTDWHLVILSSLFLKEILQGLIFYKNQLATSPVKTLFFLNMTKVSHILLKFDKGHNFYTILNYIYQENFMASNP